MCMSYELLLQELVKQVNEGGREGAPQVRGTTEAKTLSRMLTEIQEASVLVELKYTVKWY